jgi:hypothetical protein
MAEEGLDGTDVGAALEEVGGERMELVAITATHRSTLCGPSICRCPLLLRLSGGNRSDQANPRGSGRLVEGSEVPSTTQALPAPSSSRPTP